MKKRIQLLSIFLIAIFMTASAQNAEKEPVVLLTTEYGQMKIKLYNDTPKHRDNFLKLVKDSFYNGLLFHRVIKDFMIQGGDPDSKGAPASKQLGAGDVGYTVPAEFVYPKHYHKKGALAAARQGDQVNPEKRSSGCQFYIVQGKTMSDAELDRMEKGMLNKQKEARFYEIVRTKNDEIKNLRVLRDTAGLQALQNSIVAQLEDEFAKQTDLPKLSAEMKNDYKTLGGTPFLDNDYTVFGEVIEGLEVIDKIAAVKTRSGDRPEVDLKMKIEVIE
ncbi:MAG TPA: peptidylprolyl isomerase [Paludibacteraceae bacterium]|nr:peptidylprolyl isomerase [Paludibacteraceae bacterium]HPH62521.1 peptidylprolyl isomerase [Paludibacteraceae bacterium]